MKVTPVSRHVQVISGIFGVSLVFRVDAYPVPDYFWYKDGVLIDDNFTKYEIR